MKKEYLKQYFSSPDVKARHNARARESRARKRAVKIPRAESLWLFANIPFGLSSPVQDAEIIRKLRKEYKRLVINTR